MPPGFGRKGTTAIGLIDGVAPGFPVEGAAGAAV
jgi:hypothetical protein